MPRRGAILGFVSILGHALFLSIGAPRARPFVRTAEHGLTTALASASSAMVVAETAQAKRRALVDRARKDRARNQLVLGRFLVEANLIDAHERGDDFDRSEALAHYEERLAALRKALRESERLLDAVPMAFGDLRYYGQPGESMVNALFEGGGNCQQIAQLVTAAVWDIGLENEVALRFYGKPMPDGATHLAPIGIEEGVERDLMSGKPALLKGVKMRPSDLVDVYARAHALDPPAETKKAKGGGGEGEEKAEEKAQPKIEKTSFAAGLPENDDAFPGSLPLYSSQAIRAENDPNAPAVAMDREALYEEARNCAYSVRMAALSPPTVEIEQKGLAMETTRTPNQQRLERHADLLRGAENLIQDEHTDLADKLMSYACLVALGDIAAVDFALANELRLSKTALEARSRGREAGNKALATIDWKSEEGTKVLRRLSADYAGRSWLLLFLEGGGDVVLDLNARARAEDWGRISYMAALVLFPETRARALSGMQLWSIRDQVDVMHEIFHAHDHLRPWATNYELETPANRDPSADAFLKAYPVFRALAFRLWEAQRNTQESLDAFAEDAGRAKLPVEWEAAMLDYFARNTLGLYAQRPAGFAVVAALVQAARKNTHPSLDPLRRQLRYIEVEGRLDARTLADAFRLR